MWRSHHVHRVFLLAVLWLALLAAGTPAMAEGNTYDNTTRETVQQLIRANALLVAGRSTDARVLVQGMSQSIQTLSGLVSQFREIANREHARCAQRIGELEIETNQLFVQQTDIDRQIDKLAAELASAETVRKLEEAEVKRLNAELNETMQSMQQRQAKLEELQRWWWVPGYGQHLAIRTLVDQDIGQYQAAVNALHDQRQRLAETTNSLKQAQGLNATLASQKRQRGQLNRQLVEMRVSGQTDLRELNRIAVFLTDTEVFWGLAENLLKVDAESFVRRMEIIHDVLARGVQSPSFKDPSVTMAQNFQEKLVEFADSVDKQSNFLLKDTTNFCGGPPRELIANVAISDRCNIDQITMYYEIVDAKTCTFRYLNPPGCPPAAKSVSMTADALSRGRVRGTWTRSADQNWIGRPSTSPCSTAGTIYYGKLSSPDQCEVSCMSDADCTIWTFNARNQFIPGSNNQCWGGPGSLDANKGFWPGFISGGIR